MSADSFFEVAKEVLGSSGSKSIRAAKSQLTGESQGLVCEATDDLPRCAECGCEVEGPEDEMCRDCFAHSIDGSVASMRREYGTWSV